MVLSFCSFTEKNLQEVSSPVAESVAEETSPEKAKQDRSDDDDKEEDDLQRTAPQTPKRKKELDTCERNSGPYDPQYCISEENNVTRVYLNSQMPNKWREQRRGDPGEREEGEKVTESRENHAEPRVPELQLQEELVYGQWIEWKSEALQAWKLQKQTRGEESWENHSPSFSFQPTSPISVEDLEKFALRPAPRDVTIQCRVTRDRRGVEKGMYPTYYLHMEKEDGKRVGTASLRTLVNFILLSRLRQSIDFGPSLTRCF